ncbi:MAG: hypothetical protein IKU86_10005 [Thermoguttaceae bacterium]|nr:hypothetical protein [Thermoguttaceae bacterium]
MSNANEENFDDLFTKADDSDGNDDFFSSLSGSQDAADADPFAGFDSGATDDSDPFGGFGEVPGDSDAGSENPFGGFDAAPVEAEATDFAAPVAETGKKGKKAKKEKTPKVPKAKKEKAPKSDVMYGSPKPFLVLGAIFLLGIIAANVFALTTAGGGAIAFLACFDVLGLILLAIPALLIKQLRTRSVGLFDMFLALAAAFVIMGAMAVLAQQAQNYGASSKVASNVAVSTFDDRA